ncbi:MAG: serine/threonine protein kinase [Desulforhopalus sp.]|jgi:serine/threonine protein kinase
MMATCKDTLKTGDVLDQKWVILEFIDRGGMGEVYRAHQNNLNREVAIKVISREWLQATDNGDEDVETLAQRFRREVQSMAQISHPNVIQVYDHNSITVEMCGVDTPVEYIAMEYIPGGTLRATMSEEGFYPETDALKEWILKFFLPILSGVQALHDIGLVHRDLKPENILMDRDTPKIADFGLVRSHRSKPITHSIAVKGSPHYMSPEHFLDFKRADHRSDVYSLGKILYEVIDGKIKTKTIPFHSAHLSQTESSFFERLDRIIAGATEEKIAERTKSVTDLQNQLIELLDEESVEKQSQTTEKQQNSKFFLNPKWIWVGITTATLSVALMTLWHIFGGTGQPVSSKHPQEIIQLKKDGKGLTANVASNSENKEHMGEQHLIPKGRLVLPTTLESVSGQQVEIASFYMDEFLVTNQQFVEFLNHNLSRIKLENDVVKGDGANWYLLGEVYESYEPIKYQNEVFHVVDSAYASRPVLRVTGFGATAFASFFGRRLPNETEWLYVTIKGAARPQSSLNGAAATTIGSESRNMEDMMNNMMESAWSKDNLITGQKDQTDSEISRSTVNTSRKTPPATFFEQNEFGIRALNTGIAEWALRTFSSTSRDKLQDNHFIVVGSLEAHVQAESPPKKENSPPSVISRFPWEGFEEVGFRTVQTVISEN